jgi:hypothetical protein
MKRETLYCTSFCNFPHRMSDGVPVGHECYVIPPALLIAEREESPGWQAAWEEWSRGKRRRHSGRTRGEHGGSQLGEPTGRYVDQDGGANNGPR